MRELLRELAPAWRELGPSRPQRSLPYRKRAEAAKLRYVLAAEMLADQAGVALRRGALYRIANPNHLQALDETELAVVRYEAEQLAAAAKAGSPPPLPL